MCCCKGAFRLWITTCSLFITGITESVEWGNALVRKRISSRDKCHEITVAGGMEVVIKPRCCRQFVRLVFALAFMLLHRLASLSLLGQRKPVPDMDIYNDSHPSHNSKYKSLGFSAVVFLCFFKPSIACRRLLTKCCVPLFLSDPHGALVIETKPHL